MPDWQTVPIREVCEGIFDGPHATPAPSESGPIFLGIKNVTEDGHLDLSDIRHISEEEYPHWTRRVEPRAGDIVFSYEATLNRYARIPDGFRGCLGRRMALIRPDESKASGSFLYYYFFGGEWRSAIAQNTLIGSTVDRIPIARFPEFLINIPSLPTQRKIAAILSAYDDLIENNLRRIKILEEMAQALYREWFVKFRFPGHEHARFVDSPLGRIPEGWQIKALGEMAQTYRGRSYRSADLADEGGLPFINLKCVDRDGGFRRSGLKRYVGQYKDSHIARKGDIVIAVTDMTQERRIVARAALVPTVDRGCAVYSMDLVRIEPLPQMPKVFLYGMLRFSSFADDVKQHANGVNVLHLAPDRITDFEFPVPSHDLMRCFAGHLVDVLEQIDVLENQCEVLRRTRDLLLPKLISGEVDVSELDIAAPEVVGV